jgi:hypothetical protein
MAKKLTKAALAKRRDQLLAELNQLNLELGSTHGVDEDPDAGRRRAVPFRAAVLDALDDLGVLSYSRELLLYINALSGRGASATRFGALAKDEQAAFESRRPRSVYLCHGLTSDRGEAIKRLWARSDWPLEDRVVAPTTGRVQHLRVTIRLCEIAAAEGGAADPTMLKIIAADHARDLPGLRIKRGEFDLQTWRAVATEQLTKHAPGDHQRRLEAAERFRTLTAAEQLFGIAEREPLLSVPQGLGKSQHA